MNKDQYNTTIRLQSRDVRKHMLCLSYTFLNNHAQLFVVPGVIQAYNKSSSKLKSSVSGYFQGVVNLPLPSQQFSYIASNDRRKTKVITPILDRKELLHLQPLPLILINTSHLLLKQFQIPGMLSRQNALMRQSAVLTDCSLSYYNFSFWLSSLLASQSQQPNLQVLRDLNIFSHML